MNAKVYGRIFSETAAFSAWDKNREFPRYAMESEQLWEIECDSLRDAETWLAANHPEAYMGGSVVLENGDFAMLAVPCPEYGEGTFETKSARLNYVMNTVLRG